MRSANRELWAAFFAILLVTAAYFGMSALLGGTPRASGFFGHSIGVLGFVLMLMTETLYSLRKRTRKAHWGRMSDWLSFHIFTGIVGPYMVLLHTSWKFNGLAGVVMLLTTVVVFSGFVGRYIYTAVPRSVDGAEIERDQIERQVLRLEAELRALLADEPGLASALENSGALSAESAAGAVAFFVERPLSGLQQRLRWARLKRRLARQGFGPRARLGFDQLEDLLNRRQALRRQAASLATARRMLALWHAVHIPIGMVLFTAAFIHIGAAIYYATLLR